MTLSLKNLTVSALFILITTAVAACSETNDNTNIDNSDDTNQNETPLLDTTPPTMPTNLTTSAVSAASLTLSWTESTDNTNVTGYAVMRDNAEIAKTSTTRYIDATLTAATNYRYSIIAFDANNNRSEAATLAVMTLPTNDTVNTTFTPLYNLTFNNGPIGDQVTELGAAGGTFYTSEQSYEGNQAAVLNAREADSGFGYWGGIVSFQNDELFYKGDEVWIQVKTFFPAGFDYTANPRLKFLRVRTTSPTQANQGYNDWYINPPESEESPFFFIKEREDNWAPFGEESDKIQFDVWETYEMYIKFDHNYINEGGQANVKMWKNGKLLADIKNRRTLEDETSYANGFYLFTYWNPGVGRTKSLTFSNGSNGTFTDGELITSDKSASIFKVLKVYPSKIAVTSNFFYNGSWVGTPIDYGAGESITGQSSGASMTINQVIEPYPSQTQKMYVDDIIIADQKSPPTNTDTAGNIMIGINSDNYGNNNSGSNSNN